MKNIRGWVMRDRDGVGATLASLREAASAKAGPPLNREDNPAFGGTEAVKACSRFDNNLTLFERNPLSPGTGGSSECQRSGSHPHYRQPGRDGDRY